MIKVWKRAVAAAAMVVTIGMLAGCGGEDKVGIVDMTRVQQ